MTAFTTKTPDPGWEKRWVKDAFGLIYDTPHVVLLLVLTVLLSGFMVVSADNAAKGTLQSFLLVTVRPLLVIFFAIPVLACAFFLVGKHEKFFSGGVPIEIIKSAVKRGVIVGGAVFILSLLLVSPLILSGAERTPDPLSLKEVIKGGTGTLQTTFLYTWSGIFSVLCIVMLQGEQAGNDLMSRKGHQEVMKVFPRFNGMLILFYFLTPLMPVFITLPLTVFFVYWIYVAGREVIGGISGNRETEKAPEEAYA